MKLNIKDRHVKEESWGKSKVGGREVRKGR
jgi:hypothetical protein